MLVGRFHLPRVDVVAVGCEEKIVALNPPARSVPRPSAESGTVSVLFHAPPDGGGCVERLAHKPVRPWGQS